MIVIDASAVIELLLGGERGRPVERWLVDHEGQLHAPALLDLEATQALRRLVSAGHVAEPRGRAAVEILQDLPVDRHASTALLPRIWELRGNLTAYDAAYIALAEALACPLLTYDTRIAEAPGLRVEVLAPEDS